MKQLIILTLVAVIIAVSALFTVDENSVAIVKNIRTNEQQVYTTGIHFTVPMLYQVNYVYNNERDVLTKPLMGLTTKDGAKINLTLFMTWQVTDPIVYFNYISKESDSELTQTILSAIYPGLAQKVSEMTVDQVNQALNLTIGVIQLAKYGVVVKSVVVENVSLLTVVESGIITQASESGLKSESTIIAEKPVAILESSITPESNINQLLDADVDPLDLLIESAYYQAQMIKSETDVQSAQLYLQIRTQDPRFYNYFRKIMIYQDTAKSKAEVPALDQLYPQ